MRAPHLLAFAAVLAAAPACGKHEVTAARVAEPPPAPAPAPPTRPIATCERYADALMKSGDLDVDPEVRDLLRDQAALVRAASRAPRDVDRDELTLRCATGMLDLGRVPSDVYGVGSVYGAGNLGGLGTVTPAAPPPPAPTGATATTDPACRRLFEIFDQLADCPGLADAMKDTLRQARTMMIDAWGRMPQDQDTRDMMARACQTAADTYGQILAQSHCP